ncbi:hypothetical protein GMMP15_740046 [Candidatus Magnetomoraceae bacterium gMMP-15]
MAGLQDAFDKADNAAINKNPNAAMIKMADIAIIADANQIRTALSKGLKRRIIL